VLPQADRRTAGSPGSEVGRGVLPGPVASQDGDRGAVAELVTGDATRGRVAVPLNPTHAYCAFLAVGSALAGECFWPPGEGVDPDAAAAALALLRRIAPRLHPSSGELDPIAASELTRGDEVAYVLRARGTGRLASASATPAGAGPAAAPRGRRPRRTSRWAGSSAARWRPCAGRSRARAALGTAVPAAGRRASPDVPLVRPARRPRVRGTLPRPRRRAARRRPVLTGTGPVSPGPRRARPRRTAASGPGRP
jgi:hypothetical protein